MCTFLDAIDVGPDWIKFGQLDHKYWISFLKFIILKHFLNFYNFLNRLYYLIYEILNNLILQKYSFS